MSSKEIFLFLFLMGMLVFNWPILDIFRLSLPYYLFGAWILFIIIIGLFITLIKKQKMDKDV